MNTRRKFTFAVFLIITSLILCADIFFTKNTNIYFSHVLHCIAEGIIVLMFSRELRGYFYR